jgi:23S rRNA pseudouridine2457 synthase
MAQKLLYYIIHKPYRVLSQFTDEDGNPGLGSIFDLPKNVYPVGRLDLDSEGLLLLTNDRKLNHKLLDPKFSHWRKYWVQVEGKPSEEALEKLKSGVEINLKGKKHQTLPARVAAVEPTGIVERDPPVNYAKHPVSSWWQIELCEGKNRQVRRMFAGVGHPVLRLIRVGIEDLLLFPLQSGKISQISPNVLDKKLFGS